VRRARAWAESAHLRLWVVDSSVAEDGEGLALFRPGDLRILNKVDLAQRSGPGGVKLSLATGEGLGLLRGALEEIVVAALSGHDFPAITRLRHAQLLADADQHLGRALSELARAPELAAEDVRLAARALGRVTGRIDPEDVLDQVFSRFCIGK
jgi:tRNA modification GTPase